MTLLSSSHLAQDEIPPEPEIPEPPSSIAPAKARRPAPGQCGEWKGWEDFGDKPGDSLLGPVSSQPVLFVKTGAGGQLLLFSRSSGPF